MPTVAPPRPLVEVARLQKMKSLRKLLSSLCAKADAEPPVMAFDRWVARARLPSERTGGVSTSGARDDPLVPSRAAFDEQLVKDLGRSGSLTDEAARGIATEMAAAAAKAADHLHHEAGSRADGEAAVVVTAYGPSLWRLSLSGHAHAPHADVSHAHFDKLAHLHSRQVAAQSAAQSAGEGGASSEPGVLLRTRLFCALTRYQALGGHGSQCAVPPACFDVLRERLHVSLECFASPMNTRHERFCSLFPDVDGPFGSIGSFFSFRPSSGSYEANPPFEPHTLLAAVRHAEDLLTNAESRQQPLSFAFVVPTWEPLPFHHQLQKSRWLRTPESAGGTADDDGSHRGRNGGTEKGGGKGGGKGGSRCGVLKLDAASHAFVDGAQHIKEKSGDLYRVSSFGTTVAVLQTTAGATEWPVDAELYSRLAQAFKSALPSEEAAAARMERGDADAVSKLMRRRTKAGEEEGEEARGGKKRRT